MRVASQSTGFLYPECLRMGQLAFAHQHNQQEPKAAGVHVKISQGILRGHYL